MEIYLNEVSDLPAFNYFEKNYKVIENIGNGSYGKVLKCLELQSHTIVAVKIIDTSKFSNKKLNIIKTEYEILETLHHPNIVKFRNFFECNEKYYIIMNFIQSGSLNKLIFDRKESKSNLISILNLIILIDPITEEEASKIIKSILNAIDYIHSNNIIHRDLKPDNIMIQNMDDLSSICLIDFGLSIINFDTFENDYCGTLKFMAPELIDKKFYNKVNSTSSNIIINL